MLSWSLQVRLCTGQYLKCCTQAACLLFLFLCASRTIHPASSTVQKSIFKTETCKLTLHIKFIFFSLQETLHAVCQTLLLVCQTNSLKERITAKQTGMTSWKSLGFLCKALVLLKAKEDGGMEGPFTCRATMESRLPRAIPSFSKHSSRTRMALYRARCRIMICIHKHASIGHCHSMLHDEEASPH